MFSMAAKFPGRRSVLRAIGLATVASALPSGAARLATAAQSSAASGIVGTWRIWFRGNPNRAEIQGLLLLIPGGVALRLDSPTEPAAGGGAPDALDYVGPFAGQWLQLLSGEVKATVLQLNYNAQAVVMTEEVENITLRYDGGSDTIDGTYEWREATQDGRLIRSDRGTVVATRVQVEA